MAWFKKALLVLVALTMAGCDPQFNISGAYFPAWLAAMLVGLIGTWLLHVLLSRRGIAPYLKPVFLVYPAIFTIITCLIWLVFFS